MTAYEPFATAFFAIALVDLIHRRLRLHVFKA